MFRFVYRFIAVFALAACAGACLSAAGASGGVVYNLSGSFNTNYIHVIRVDVDYGPTAQSVVVDCTLGSTTGPGFDFELIDWDSHVQASTGAVQSAQVFPLGSNSAQLTMPARTGVHPMMIRLRNMLTLGQDTDFVGYLDLVGGTVVNRTDSDSLYVDYSDPWRVLYGDMQASFVTYHPGNRSLDTLVRADMGAGAQPSVFRFECSGQGISNIIVSWPDGAGGRQQYVVNANSGGNIIFAPSTLPRYITVPAQAGVVEFTISVNEGANFYYADWVLYAPGDTPITGMESPFSGNGSSGGKGGCSTEEGGWPLPTAIAGAAAAALLVRRKRSAR